MGHHFERTDAAGATHQIAYASQEGASPGVVFCGGFRSDMTGTKATALAEWAERTGRGFTRFDYFGHGQSSGAFIDGTASHWRDDVCAVLDHLTDGAQILVGSSFGGYMSLLAALDRPEKVAGLVLIAPAPDMTERLLWKTMPAAARAEIESEGVTLRPSEDGDYPVTRALIEDGRGHLVLDKPIALDIPVAIIHGQQDVVVPWRLSLKLAERLEGAVELVLLKDGDHRLNAPAQLVAIIARIEAVASEIARRE